MLERTNAACGSISATKLMRIANKKEDVFKYINMSNGPDVCWQWRGPVGGRTREPRPYFTADGKRYLAYRLVYELVNGVTLATEQLILHSCDNGRMPIGCCNPKHLRIGSVQENSNDMKNRERHGLPHNTVRNIRKLLREGRTQQEIAELYGISQENVSAINRRVTYDHVSDYEVPPD